MDHDSFVLTRSRIQFCVLWWTTTKGGRFTRARAADDAVVNDGTAVDRNLQAVVCVVVLGRFVIWIELQERHRHI